MLVACCLSSALVILSSCHSFAHSTTTSVVWYTRAIRPRRSSGDHMRLASTKLTQRALALLAACALALPQAGRAAPLPQAGGLDQPLMAANMCGAGDPGDVHFTLAATGDTFPHDNIQTVGEAQGYDYLFDHVRPFLKA